MAIGIRPPYERIYWRGVRLNRRTVAMLKWAEKKAGLPTGRLLLAQGSYNAGGVSASGGTHDGGGSVDCRVGHLSSTERAALVVALKKAGFAAWFREAVPGLWGAHIHAVAFGDRDASPQARAQLVAFDANRDGLRGNRWDATFRPSPKVEWNYRLGRPVRR